jgi:hypothetical protein
MITVPTTIAAQMGPTDVTLFKSQEEGVWFPPGPKHDSLRWSGSSLARFSQCIHLLNPFRVGRLSGKDLSAASLSFTERGRYLEFMHLPCPPCISLLGSNRPMLADCESAMEMARGNAPLARLDAKPQDSVVTEQQWCAFAGLRAFPCSQIRNLSVGLQLDTFVLDRPEVRFMLFSAELFSGELV